MINYFYFFYFTFFFTGDEKQTTLSEIEKEQIIDMHNYWRNEVGVGQSLEWSDVLAKVATVWAKELAKKGCAFEHSTNYPYGENLFKATTGYFNAKQVVDAWASERAYYDYEQNTCEPDQVCGHYTQIVWNTTTRVGCAKVECDGFEIWVCEYDPPGNWEGEKPY